MSHLDIAVDPIPGPLQFGTPLRWFLRGMAVGMLWMASLNALSYFFRSDNWGSLIGKTNHSGEAIGFPFQVWEAGNTYGGYFADYPMIGLNMLIAAIASLPLGVVAAKSTRWLNTLLFDSFGAEALGGDAIADRQPIQFSLQSLMIATTVAAVLAMIASRFAARPETLMAIYALGPLALVLLAMLPRRLSWQQRVGIITPAALTLIAVAIAVGYVLHIEFDKVLMGIFLCWTPQSAIAAISLIVIVFMQLSHQRQHSRAKDNACPHQPS